MKQSKSTSTNSLFKRIPRFVLLLITIIIVLGLYFLYRKTIPMKSISKGFLIKNQKSYAFEKRRNYFVAENVLIIDKTDTIIVEVKRSGEIKKIIKLNNGNEVEIQLSDLPDIPQKQKDALIKFE